MRAGGALHALTPALARERARMGALRARTMGACLCQRGMGSIGALPSLPSNVSTGQYSAALQSAIDQQSASIKATLAAHGGAALTSAQVQQGASSLLSLAQTGYNPDRPGDSANLVHVISGGLCLIPAVGPLLGGAVEGLWAVGNALGCPTEQAFASIGFGSPSPACGGHPCTTSGNWTTASVLTENAGALPPMPVGSFASLMVPALAENAAQAADCKPSIPPNVLVDAVVMLWNQNHAGPAVPYFIPAIGETLGGAMGSTMLLGGMGYRVSGSTPSARAGLHPNIYYAFQPASKAVADGLLQVSGTRIVYWPYLTLAGAPGVALTSPRIVMVNSGAALDFQPAVSAAVAAALAASTPHHITFHLGPPPPATTAASAKAPVSKPMSTGGKVAATAAAAGAGTLLWWLATHGWKWANPRWAARLLR